MGSNEIVVAVLDSGLQWDHPDLEGNVFINWGEVAAGAEDGLDNDSNGFVDDVIGWNFIGAHNNPYPGTTWDAHGTAVAGIAAAVGNNGLGITGAAPQVRMLPIRISGAWSAENPGFLPAAEIANAVLYAAGQSGDHEETWRGADVMVMSWGHNTPPAGSGYLSDAVEWAATNGRSGLGMPIFAAAGNSGASAGQVAYPARLDSVIAVGATDHNDQRAAYSQYGSQLDLVAPGGTPEAPVLTTDLIGFYGLSPGDYAFIWGTSFAAPLAAGVAALLLSRNPELTAAEVRDALISTADKVGRVTYDPITGFHQEYGYGRVNAEAALGAITADTTGPTVTSVDITWHGGDINPGDQRVVITCTFSERTVWTPQDIRITSPTDVEITPQWRSGWGTKKLVMHLPTLTESGTYSLWLGADTFADQAGNALGGGQDYSDTFHIDAAVVPVPTAPDLLDGSDSGNGLPGTTTDNITKVKTPTFRVSVGQGAQTAELFVLVRRMTTWGEWDVAVADVDVMAQQSDYDITVPQLADGVYTVYSRAANSQGRISANSAPLTLTIDTKAQTPVLYVKTYQNKPRIYGTAEPRSRIEIWRGKTRLTSAVAANAKGKWSFDDTKYRSGPVTYKARATDAAGNVSKVTGLVQYPPGKKDRGATAHSVAFSGIGDMFAAKGSGGTTDDSTLVLHGFAPPRYTVSISLEGVGELGTTEANSDGRWVFNYSGTSLSNGQYTFTASAEDLDGTVIAADEPFVITIDDSEVYFPMIGNVKAEGLGDTQYVQSGQATRLGTWTFEGMGIAGTRVRLKQVGGTWGDPVDVGADRIWRISYSPSSLEREVAHDFIVQPVTGSGTYEDPYVAVDDVSARFRIIYDDVAPTLVYHMAVPDPDDPVVDSIELGFSEPVYGLDEVQLILSTPYDSYLLGSEQTPWTEDNVHWIVPNLSGYTDLEGEYQLSIMPEQYVVDATGNAWSGGFPPFFVITGTNDGETFLLEEDPFHTGIIRITITGNGSRQVLTQPEQIIINALDGDDELINHLPPDLLPEAGIFFRGGDGTDRVELHGTSADDVITYGDDEAVHSHDDDYGVITAEDVEDWTLVISDGADDVSVWGGTLNITGTGPWGEGSALHIDGGVVQLDADAGDGSNKTLTINVNDEGSVIFTTTQHLAALNVNDGGEAVVAAGGDKMIVAGALNAGQYGLLDLKDNDLLVGSADVADVRGWIVSAYDGGTWQGYGITSTRITPGTHALAYSAGNDAAINWMGGSFGGESFGSSAVLVKYTYAGDANLDGMVDVVDLGILSTNWQQYGGWTRADFNYSGFVDIVDMGILSTNWQKGVGDPLRMGDGFLETLLSADFAKLLEQQEVLDWLSAGADGLLE